MSLIRLLSIVSLCLLASSVVASEFSSLEEKMTRAEFSAAGLDRLTPEELAQLNSWLREQWPQRASSAGLRQQPEGDRRGLIERIAGNEEDIVSRLPGTFTGWNSNTTFRLENGMVWRVSEGSSFSVRAIENPQVTISKGMFNAWFLRVEGYNSQVRVRRVE